MNEPTELELLLANTWEQFSTSGMCEYGKVCDSCDCFAGDGKEKDAYALSYGRYAAAKVVALLAPKVAELMASKVIDE